MVPYEKQIYSHKCATKTPESLFVDDYFLLKNEIHIKTAARQNMKCDATILFLFCVCVDEFFTHNKTPNSV
jgi:hypothetical protein